MATSEGKHVIIGPTKAGKTYLLAALWHSTIMADSDYSGPPGKSQAIGIMPQSDPMRDLIKRCADVARTGEIRVPGSLQNQRYEFTYEVRWRDETAWFLKDRVSTTRFTMLDGPGGALFGGEVGGDVDEAAMDDFRKELIAELKTADGILLCVDATDRSAVFTMFEKLPEILMDAGSDGRLPCQRFVICLTKADKLFAEFGRASYDKLMESQARERAARIISRPNMKVLRSYLNERSIARVGWTSVYGFHEKQSNYDVVHDKLLFREDNGVDPEDVIEFWKPFRVVDPFVFMTAGVEMALEPLWG